MRRKQGFTLIELLVVIAIIAILAAILFPVFAAAREKASQTRCMSNMKELSVAIMQYADNANNALPDPWHQTGGDTDWHYVGPGNLTWRERIQPYIKSKGVLDCPSKTYAWTTTNLPPGVDRRDTNTANGGQSHFSHYGMAVGLTTGGLCKDGFLTACDTWGFGFVYMSAITQPSKTIMIAENEDGDWSVEPMTSWFAWGGPGSFYPYHLRHSNDPKDTNAGGNFVFCDGHVKFMSVDASESLDTTVSPHVKRFTYWIADRRVVVPPMTVN